MSEHAPAPEASGEEAVFDWQKSLNWITPAFTAILLAATVYLWTQSRSTRKQLERFNAIEEAQGDAEALGQVAQAYPESAEAPNALALAVAERLRDGNAASAIELADQYLSLYPEHPLNESVSQNRNLALEQEGKLEEALQGFKSVPESSIIYPQSLLNQARVLENMDKADEALAIYENIEREFSGDVWANQAELAKLELERRQRLAAPADSE